MFGFLSSLWAVICFMFYLLACIPTRIKLGMAVTTVLMAVLYITGLFTWPVDAFCTFTVFWFSSAWEMTVWAVFTFKEWAGVITACCALYLVYRARSSTSTSNYATTTPSLYARKIPIADGSQSNSNGLRSIPSGPIVSRWEKGTRIDSYADGSKIAYTATGEVVFYAPNEQYRDVPPTQDQQSS